MSGRATFLLLIAFIAAALWVWFDRAEEESSAGAPEEERTALLSFSPERVEAIQLHRESLQLRLERRDGTWRGAQRPEMIDDFLRNLSELVEIRRLDVARGELSDYGLDPPRATLELFLREEAPVVLLVGDRNPSLTSTYVQIGPGGPVVITGAVLLWELEKLLSAVTGYGSSPAAS